MRTVKVTELQKQMMMVGAFTIALVAIGIGLAVVPAFKKISKMRIEISQTGRKQELLRQIQKSQERVGSLEAELLKDKEKLLVLSHVSTLANQAGLEVDSVSPEAAKDSGKGIYSAYGVRVKAAGSFQKALNFMGELERKKPKLLITNFELNRNASSKSSSEAGAVISLSLGVQTLILNSQEADASVRGR